MTISLQAAAGADTYNWWASLNHGGLLIAPSKLTEFFGAEPLSPLPRYIEDRLRRDVTLLQDGKQEQLGALLDTVLEEVLHLNGNGWLKGSAVDRDWSQQGITREVIRPRRVWIDDLGTVLPVFVADGAEGQKVARLGIGRGKRAVSRVLEWLRKADQSVALLTNGRQWRLIHAGTDYDAWSEWDIDFWFEEGKPSAQVTALRLLVGETALRAPAPNLPSPLLAAIQASRQGQAELSDVLGERVRQAVELLIRESAAAIAPLVVGENPISHRDIYIAATRIIMRCVVILFAEARDLLPRENPIYHGSYGLQGLREQMDRMAGGRTGRLRQCFNAWPRLLALFRLVYEGCAHEALPVPGYGGGLFTPGEPASRDPILRSLAAFEHPTHTPADAVVHQILELLCRSKVKVRQGRRSTWVEAPVDFSDLSSEYIGILYEGLLDFELRQAATNTPMIFLNLGDQPVLPLLRLEEMDDSTLEKLVEKLKQKAKSEPGEEEAGEGEDTEAIEDELEVEEEVLEEDATEEELIAEDSALEEDLPRQLREQAQQLAVRAVKAGKLLAKPKGRKAEALAAYEDGVAKMARQLIGRIVLPGEWFLVRWGGTRKGSGTFYTRPQLAVPTVQRTLMPLAYSTSDESGGEAVPGTWVPKTPGEILAVKVCDPACGSASFLIAALRYLTNALWESLFQHEWLVEAGAGIKVAIPVDAQPAWFAECVKDLPVTVENAEAYAKPRLKRYVVERCIYGVDINPLAVELGRLALWVETMDRSLPFSFLDHKIKCGNALVGCWFDQFRDYPIMAWEREGGDKSHTKGIHFEADTWTKKIKHLRGGIVREELRELISGGVQLSTQENRLLQSPEQTHEEVMAAVENIHAAVLDPNHQAKNYEREFRQKEAIRQLKWAFDCWCAVWFWRGERLDSAPTPLRFVDPPAETKAEVERLVGEYRFFHWELEFPDVFVAKESGFSAIVGNPPWETLQPNSKEFFSNIDPLYRTYGKQEALQIQTAYFKKDPAVEQSWLNYCANFKAIANWYKHVAYPFGVNQEGEVTFSLSSPKRINKELHAFWEANRLKRKGFSGSQHPYQYQGEGKPYTYKMFIEIGHALIANGGRLGFIVPSGLYSDKGASNLRKLFLNNCQWTHLYAFQNERFVFSSIDHRNKMVVFSITKGGQTTEIATRFRLGPGDSPEAQELMTDILDISNYLIVPAERVKRFSPNTEALLEIRTERDLAILEKMYTNGVLLGENGTQGWGIKYRQGDFNMTSDSKLFPPRPKWEAQGYCPDEYGHWLKGNWQPYKGEASILKRPEGLILSADGLSAIDLAEVEDVALPLYQGVMIWQFESAFNEYLSSSNSKSEWKTRFGYASKLPSSQFLMSVKTARESVVSSLDYRLGFRAVQNSLNKRTMIANLVPACPCGNSVATLHTGTLEKNLYLLAFLCSFPLDTALRSRMSQANVNWFYVEELATPFLNSVSKNAHQDLILKAAGLNATLSSALPCWLELTLSFPNLKTKNLKAQLAVTDYERLRLKCIVEVIVSELYKLTLEEFAWLVKDSDHPAMKVCDNTFARTLEPKGFWRVDKEKDPELRHTVLSLIAFHELKKIGLEAFLNLNDGEGWMLPETLRLADYGLGHDDRAQSPQPVAARLGPRFLPWQLEGTPAESWAECERHAENLRRLLGNPPQPPTPSHTGEKGIKAPTVVPLPVSGQGVETEDKLQQLGLFDRSG